MRRDGVAKGAPAARTRALFLAIGAGVLARLLVIAVAMIRRGPEAFIVPDSATYLWLANSLAAGRGFVDAWGKPELFRTPAYPLLLAAGAASPVTWALLANLVLLAGIILLTFVLARHVTGDETLAGVCAIAVAIEPTLMSWSLRVMPETLLTLCLVVFACAALRAIDSRRPLWILAAAASICAAAYAKPIAYPLVFLLCAISLLRPRAALIFVLACAAFLLPWHLRNEARTGHFVFSTLFARAAYLGVGGSIVAQREHRPYDTVRMEMLDHIDVHGRAADPSQYAREGLSILASDPLGYAKTHVRGMLRTMFDPGASEYLRFAGLYGEGGRARLASRGVGGVARAYPLMFWSSVALALLLAPLVLLPLLGLIRAREPASLLLALIAAYVITAGGGVPGQARFACPRYRFSW